MFQIWHFLLNLQIFYSRQKIFRELMNITVKSQVKLPILNNPNNLISLQLDQQELKQLPLEQRTQYFGMIKKQANYYLLNAFRSLQTKNYTQAKNILIFIADSCSCIDPPDKQSQQLIQLCCEELAQIKKIEDWNKMQHQDALHQSQRFGSKKIQLFVMKYNKFSGEFQCDEVDRKKVNPEVLFYLSKINSVLFGQQNTESLHSFLAMLKQYWIELFLIPIFIMAFLLLLLTDMKEVLFNIKRDTFDAPTAIIGCLFLVPLFVIFFKSPITKNSLFFQKKLTEIIKKINNECRSKSKKILFMMPQGMQLNVKVEYDKINDRLDKDIVKQQQSTPAQSVSDDLQIDISKLRRKVTLHNRQQ